MPEETATTTSTPAQPKERKQGTVKWFSAEKGFGFIQCSSGEDIFCHFSDIQGDEFKTLNEDDCVEFDIVETAKGPKANRIVRLESSASKPASKPARKKASHF
jgi:cold shock protein